MLDNDRHAREAPISSGPLDFVMAGISFTAFLSGNLIALYNFFIVTSESMKKLTFGYGFLPVWS